MYAGHPWLDLQERNLPYPEPTHATHRYPCNALFFSSKMSRSSVVESKTIVLVSQGNQESDNVQDDQIATFNQDDEEDTEAQEKD